MKKPELSRNQIVAGIFLVSLMTKAAFVLSCPQAAPDSGVYDRIALNLVRGLGYTFDGSTPHVVRPPLYPFFLAGFYALVGQNFLLVRLAQALIDSITVIFVYKLGKSISGRDQVGYISALIACFYPELVAPTAFILTETMTTFLLTAFMWFLIESIKRSRISLSLAGGVLLGLTTLCRPVTLAFPPFLFVGLFLIYRKRWVRCWLLLCLGMAITIAPWTIRNYITFKAFIPVTVGAGSNLWTGSYVPWDGDFNFKDPSDWNEIKKGLSEIEADKKLKEEALRNISSAPMTYLLLCGKKFIRFWFGIPGSKQLLIGKPLAAASLYILHWLTLLLFIVGFSAPLIRGSRERWVAMTLVIYFTLIHGALFAIPRYRAPIIPIVLVFAGSGIARLLPLKRRPGI